MRPMRPIGPIRPIRPIRLIRPISPIRPIRPIGPIILLLLLLSSCRRYELELYDDGKADVHFTFDWLTRYREVPEGMTFMWAHDGDAITYYDPTYRVTERTERLDAGTYYVTVMNKSFGEYGTMSFYRRNSHDEIMAVANTYHISDENAWDNGRTYMEEPERIGVASDTVQVPKTIDDITFRNYKEPSTQETIHLERKDTILPMTTTLNIHVKVRGIKYMRSLAGGGLSGYIMGLADGFLLNQRWRRTNVGDIKLTRWKMGYDDYNAYPDEALATDSLVRDGYIGWVHTSVETFGLPHGKELLRWRTPQDNYILLHFTLIDGRILNFGYPVGLNIRYRGDDGETEIFTQGDVTLELDLVIDAPFYGDDQVPTLPYAQPSGSSAFDATVEPWGDDVNVDIPM